MKILYDHQIFSLQLYGGVSRYFVELARQFSNCDETDVMVLAPLYINRHLRELDTSIVSGRFIGSTPKGISKILGVTNKMMSPSRMSRFGPDILHETWYPDRPGGRKTNQRVVVTVYDMIQERFPEYFRKADPTARRKQLAISRADHVLCISETTRRDLLELADIDEEKVTAVHIGFDAPAIEGEHASRPVDCPYLLYVGQRGGYKNFSRLLDAYVRSPSLKGNFRLVAFGGRKPTDGEVATLRRNGLPAEQLVWMSGDDRLLGQLYRHASVFVYPSLYEGFGIPPLEAMNQGCPVACSNGGSIPEVAGDAAEYFDPEDCDAIAAAIERVVQSSEYASNLTDLGRRRIQTFSWATCAAKTRAVYAELL